jgi:hypothetical protein
MSENTRRCDPRPESSAEAGFALVLAIMALMLLTFLGLTLATTTSTELQIATNYRWSQQALYNAEAGIEAAKTILSHLNASDFLPVLPTDRGVGTIWGRTGDPAPAAPGPPAEVGPGVKDDWGNDLRTWENQTCDTRGGGVGYGVIVNDLSGTTLAGGPEGILQYKTTLLGQRLNGAVTVWIRRAIRINTDGGFQDDPSPLAAVITAEGVAPYSDGSITSAFAQANRATHVLEVSLLRAPGSGTPCDAYRAQSGSGVSGSGFGVCGTLKLDCTGGAGGGESGLLSGALGDAARDEGGTLAIGSGQAGTLGSLETAAGSGTCVQ